MATTNVNSFKADNVQNLTLKVPKVFFFPPEGALDQWFPTWCLGPDSKSCETVSLLIE